MALSLTVLIGFAGAAVDIAFWETNLRAMQGAADQAAYSAVIAASNGGSPATNAKGITAQTGFVDGRGGVTVTVNNPPAAGSSTGNGKAWEVVISEPQPLWFAKLFLSSPPVATARAVAVPGPGGVYCILTLGPGRGTISLQGGPQLNTPNCDIQANSNDSAAVTIGGSGTIIAQTLSTVGTPGYSINSTSGRISALLEPGAPTIDDPYSKVTLPPSSSWPGAGQSACQTVPSIGNHQTTTLSPGCYTGTISVGNGGTLKLNPGTYYIDRGTLSASGGTVTGTGVTIILTSSTGANYSTINFGGNNTVTLTAPNSGTYSGLTIFADRRAPNSITNTLGGGSNQSFTGALYFPSTSLNFGGNATATACTQLIAWTLTFSGSSSFSSNCSGVGTKTISGPTTVVTE